MGDSKLIYQLQDKLILAHKGHEALRNLAEMSDTTKEQVLNLVGYVATQKGADLKQVLIDVKDSLYPDKRIENDDKVEREAVELKQELALIAEFKGELSLFHDDFVTELRDRAYRAERRAEWVRSERERLKKEQEAAIKGGALPFRDSAVG